MTLQENIDYELVPGAGENWDVRILAGEFTETVLNFSKLKIEEDGETMSFNFDVISSPDPDLEADTNIDLQKYAGEILIAILESATVKKNENV